MIVKTFSNHRAAADLHKIFACSTCRLIFNQKKRKVYLHHFSLGHDELCLHIHFNYSNYGQYNQGQDI